MACQNDAITRRASAAVTLSREMPRRALRSPTRNGSADGMRATRIARRVRQPSRHPAAMTIRRLLRAIRLNFLYSMEHASS
jgi:hypothetical protein